MGADSKIEWTEHTFNPWVGCTKISAACDNCYADSWAKRTGHPELWKGERRRTTSQNWQQPIRWNAEAFLAGRRDRVFCASLADVFDNQVPGRWRDDLWHRIEQTPNLDWLLLTKRPQNIVKMLPDPRTGTQPWGIGWPNVWLGTTVESQEMADLRIPHLLAVPAAKRFLSMEPLLGPVDIAWALDSNVLEIAAGFLQRGHFSPGLETLRPLDWVITGGESGPKARPSHPDWFRSLRDQCQAAGVPFLHKQNGEWVSASEVAGPGDHFKFPDGATVRRAGKKLAGRTIDGRTWDERPQP